MRATFIAVRALALTLTLLGIATVRPSSAAELNCTDGCFISDGLYQGLYWSTVPLQPTGTGVIDSFLRIQQTPLEEGMNTDFRPVTHDEKTDPNYTRDIQLGELRQVTLDDGITYYELLLDLNEPSGMGDQSFISLVGLKLCISPTGQQYNEAGGGCAEVGSSVEEKYNLDSGMDGQVNLDYDYLDNGSGASDLFVYIPIDLLATFSDGTATTSATYFYLWSQFGRLSGTDFKSQDGYEEWATRIGTNGEEPPLPNPTAPEPASLVLFGTGLAIASFRFRRARKRT